MPQDTSEFPTRRATLAVIGGALLSPVAGAVQAEAQQTEQDILKQLGGRTSRAPTNKERDIIEALRHREARSITEEDRTVVAEIARDKRSIDLEINFEFNSAVLSPKSTPLAVKLGRALLDPQFKGDVFLVGGHTDGKGADAYNLDLSRRRAEAIKAFLVESFGIPAANLIPIGFGREHLKNPGNPFADENRRVQVVRMLEGE